MTPIGPPISRDDAQREAADELLKPGYEHEPLVDEVWRRLQQFLGDLTNPEVDGAPAGGVIAAVLIVLIVGGLAGLLIWRLRRTTRGAAGGGGELFGTRARTAVEHRQEAERLAGEELWAEAVQERLRAIARDLEERALVDGLPGRTADELAAEAGRALPGFAGELAAAARVFDDVTYGDVPGTAEAYGMLRDLDERLRQARPTPLPPQPPLPGQPPQPPLPGQPPFSGQAPRSAVNGQEGPR
ncbi:DUF4129 domain-containing protein [Nonomuraea sp. NPDC050310]|uniref:DUF4129 domain-containing protein n=1 Tax=Nonomuraea sp. NPDC050310 TaxID=3154935 RepID=UPI0033FBA23D